MDDSHRDKFARLLALSELRVAQIKANPVPFLDDVAGELFRLRRAIQDAVMMLDGVDSMDIAREEFPTLAPSIVETVTIRNRRAVAHLRDALLSA